MSKELPLYTRSINTELLNNYTPDLKNPNIIHSIRELEGSQLAVQQEEVIKKEVVNNVKYKEIVNCKTARRRFKVKFTDETDYTLKRCNENPLIVPSFNCSANENEIELAEFGALNLKLMKNRRLTTSERDKKMMKIIEKKNTRKKLKKCEGRICGLCGTKDTPEWRLGPGSVLNLCNACGLQYRKILHE